MKLESSLIFRGCGWPSTKPKPTWPIEDKACVVTVNKLTDNLFGKEFLGYHYDKTKFCFVDSEDTPDFDYNQNLNCTLLSPRPPAGKKGRTNNPQEEQMSKPLSRCLFPTQTSDSNNKPQAVKTKQQGELVPTTQSNCIFKSLQLLPESFKQCMSQAAMRHKLSHIKLPLVTSLINERDVVSIYRKFQEENPFSLKCYPSDKVMTVACNIMSACHSQVTQENIAQLDESDGPSGIRINKLGNFSNNGIKVLLRYCETTRKKWLGLV